jgi:hypothetical protein
MGTHEKVCMNIEIITSFNKTYYNNIGKDCVDTWLEYWPRELSLTCYVEEFSLDDNPRIKQIDFSQLGKDYETFQHTKSIGGQERKFAKKAFSFIHSLHNSVADRIIWLDADVISTAKFPMDILKSILSDDVLSTHMGVTYHETKSGIAGRWFVPETGFFAVNTRHEKFETFKKLYTERYTSHNKEGLRRFFDNDVYGWAIEETNAKCLDLCAKFKKPYKTPIKHTVLGPYMHHYKAKSKKDYASGD